MSDELGRPRLSRFDRPALSLSELLRAEGPDFIWQAVWTMHGQRVDRLTFEELLTLLNRPGGKYIVLDQLYRSMPPGQVSATLPGLAQILQVERRRYVPVIGTVLASAVMLTQRYPALGSPVRFVRSIPGKFRWTYRHAGKFAVRIAAKAGLPNRVEIRRTFRVSHEPPASDLTKRAVSIYQELCTAIDQREIAN
jgi:hypothetical protein